MMKVINKLAEILCVAIFGVYAQGGINHEKNI